MIELKYELNSLYEQGLRRDLINPQGIDFNSNDYLSLAKNEKIAQALAQYLSKNLMLGSMGSRLVCGNHKEIISLEEYASNFFQRPKALAFSSGFLANLAVISSLGKNKLIFSDEDNHTSIIYGISSAKANYKIFNHNDCDHLEYLLKRSLSKKNKIIITESVYSTDGSIADLSNMLYLAKKYDAHIIVDEAHATGVLGPKGRGLLANIKFDDDYVTSIHTCGKALGAMGAIVTCSRLVKKYLINTSRPFIFTTALSPFLAMHIKLALKFAKKAKEDRKKLFELWQYGKKHFSKYFLRDYFSPIISINISGANKIIKASKFLQKEGFAVTAFRYPSVKKNKEALRITLHAHNTKEQMDLLFSALNRALGEL